MNHTIEFTNSATYKCLGDMQEGSLELCLTYCGWESCNPAHRFGPNQRASSVLHVIQKGKGTLEINKKVYQLKAGDAFFLPPGVEAWYERIGKNHGVICGSDLSELMRRNMSVVQVLA